ncbi:fimbrial assembly protein [Oceanisphaera sp.]|uniref:fimbrial assembly protein n=1 Tax=Oceanisphaera sp. TaxID=1929979 RepID=UPI003A95DA03
MKQRIEFYQAALKPDQDHANLGLLWKVSLAIVVLWGAIFANAGFNSYQLEQQNNALRAAVMAGTRDTEQLHQTLALLNGRKDDSERQRVEQNIKARQQLLSLLAQKNLVSYASTLNDLAHIPWQGVALKGLTLQGKQMVLRGEAARASDVPAWILGFEQRSSLRGHAFGQLAINQQPEGGFSFSLYSAEMTP